MIIYTYSIYKIIILNRFESNRENLKSSYPTYDYPTRNRGNLVTPIFGVNSIKFNYEYQFMIVWNGIIAHIREMSPFQ